MDFELDYTPEDIGEIIMLLRIKHYKMSIDEFCKKTGINNKTLPLVEEGRSAHVYTTFKKLIEDGYFKNVKLHLSFSV